MTHSDLVTTLLLVGFVTIEHLYDNDDSNVVIVNLNKKSTRFDVDRSYDGIWRSVGVGVPFDIGAIKLVDGRVLVLYELDEPANDTWAHHHIFNGPTEAWDFIRNFLQEHP